MSSIALPGPLFPFSAEIVSMDFDPVVLKSAEDLVAERLTGFRVPLAKLLDDVEGPRVGDPS